MREPWLPAEFRRSTLVFAIDLAHVLALTNAFRDMGVDAHCVHHKTPAADRNAILAAFRAGNIPVLVNCSVLTEGADFPQIDCILLARPTRSSNLFLQMLGRGLRLSPGKEDAHIIDMTGKIDGSSGSGGGRLLMGVCTLFGIDPTEAIEGMSQST